MSHAEGQIVWHKAIAKQPAIKQLHGFSGIRDEARSLHFRKVSSNEYYIRYTYLQAILTKSQFDKYIKPMLENGELIPARRELSLSLEDNFKRQIQTKIEEEKETAKKKAEADAYNALSDKDKKEHNKITDAQKLISTLKTKREKIIALHQLGSYSKGEIQMITECDLSYLEEVYNKDIYNVVSE